MNRQASRLAAVRYRLAVFVLCASVIVSVVLGCSVDMCSREYSSVVLMSSHSRGPTRGSSGVTPEHYCSLLNAYNHCIRSIARSCRGNLEFHTIQTLLKQWKYHYNCSGNRFKAIASNQRKSGLVNSESQNGHHWSHEQSHQKESFGHQLNHEVNDEHQQRLQQCLSAAYNYTIYKGNDTEYLQPKDERIKLLVSEASDDETVQSDQINNSFAHSTRKKHNRRKSRRHRSPENEFKPVKGLPLKAVDDDDDDDSDSDGGDSDSDNEEVVQTIAEMDANKLLSLLSLQSSQSSSPSSLSATSSSTSAKTSSSPQTPPSPPLTCIIYGDPHLRTFNSQYQTCKCLGAWPLIDHPLFAVQITNSRLRGLNQQITGVTKVTVLVRQFTVCGIFNDLLYEADSTSSEGGPSLATTFIDGSASISNNLIRIASSSNNKVVTIHLDHIGVRVYIGQFGSSNYLNVVIKFRSATSTVKQQLVLNSISSNSLCKMGCPKREQIDIKNILRATSVNIDEFESNSEPIDETDGHKSSDLDADSDSESLSDQQDIDEPCHALRGYYRISCLYDLTIKGVKDVNNACRFAQSFDERKSIELSEINANENDITVQSIVKSLSNQSFHRIHILLVIVISLFCSYYYYHTIEMF